MLDGIGLLDDHDSACHCQMFSFFRSRSSAVGLRFGWQRCMCDMISCEVTATTS